VDIHVARQVRDELLAAARDQVGDPRRQVRGREDLGELERGEGSRLGDQDDGCVAGGMTGAKCDTRPSRSGVSGATMPTTAVGSATEKSK
jgi:hypothetical protein